MAAIFPQQKLLDLRQRASTEAERAFVAARSAVEASHEALRGARANLKNAIAGRMESAAQGNVMQLGSREAFIQRRRAEVDDASRVALSAEAEAKSAKRAFDGASIAFKAIEKLKASWEEGEARRKGRRAEAALDELATARHGRERGGSR